MRDHLGSWRRWPNPFDLNGAQERTRTSTPLRELAPEASASANSATWAMRAARNKPQPYCRAADGLSTKHHYMKDFRRVRWRRVGNRAVPQFPVSRFVGRQSGSTSKQRGFALYPASSEREHTTKRQTNSAESPAAPLGPRIFQACRREHNASRARENTSDSYRDFR